jgi:hypothetical protein
MCGIDPGKSYAPSASGRTAKLKFPRVETMG